MEIKETALKGLVEIFPRVFEDSRGYFLETYNEEAFRKAGLPFIFVQDNQSFSIKGVLRGLHFQKEPHSQGKLVRVISGRVLDVVVDIRPDSATFGKHVCFELDAKSGIMAYVPEGFAHGFVALEDTVFSYKCTNIYNKSAESGILWNDLELNIDWGISDPIVSEKDALLPAFSELLKSAKA